MELLSVTYGLFVGIVLTLTIQIYVYCRWCLIQKPKQLPKHEIHEGFSLPNDIINLLLLDENQKKYDNSCVCLNLLAQFLFREWRDTSQFRRWLMRRLTNEFSDMLKGKAGLLIEAISIKDYSVGKLLPILKSAKLISHKLHEQSNLLEEVTTEVDIHYDGGFSLSLDVDIKRISRTVQLSVNVLKLSGNARLQFSRQPFTHWSFSFINEPILEMKVESLWESKPIIRTVTTVIENQIKRVVRKKHTLPGYKIRRNPFIPQNNCFLQTPKDVILNEVKVTVGSLKIKVMECSRVPTPKINTKLYCTIAIDATKWLDLVQSKRLFRVQHDIILRREEENEELGMSFSCDSQQPHKNSTIVKVVNQHTPAELCGIKKGDVILQINNIKVKDFRHAAVLIKKSGKCISFRIERCVKNKNSLGDFKEFEFQEKFVGESFDEPFLEVSVNEIPKNDNDNQLRNRKENNPQENDVNSDICKITSFSILQEAFMEDISTCDLKTTKSIPCKENPQFNEELVFQVEEQHRFVNICLWNQATNDDNNDKKNDILLAFTSIPLLSIAFECMYTSRGNARLIYSMTAADIKSEVNRNKNFTTHKGFDEKLFGGDITLGFVYENSKVTEKERRKVAVEQIQEVKVAKEDSKEVIKDKEIIEESHLFIVTTFQTKPICNVCDKKIWFNGGLRCANCLIICHKKCLERAKFSKVCKKFLYKQPPIIVTPSQITTNPSPVPGKKLNSVSTITSVVSSGSQVLKRTLLRFKKSDDAKNQIIFSPRDDDSVKLESNLNNEIIPVCIPERKRRNSAPEIENDVEINVNKSSNGERLLERRSHEIELEAITKARQVGEELFADLSPEERKDEFDERIERQQKAIDEEILRKNELIEKRLSCKEDTNLFILNRQIAKCEDRIEALRVLLLQSFSGLQHTLDNNKLISLTNDEELKCNIQQTNEFLTLQTDSEQDTDTDLDEI